MTEGIIALVGVLIGAVAGLGGTFITLLHTSRQWKKDSEERFFYEVYPKRLSIYEDVIKELIALSKKERESLETPFTLGEALEASKDNLHILDSLRARLELFGSPAARNIISGLWIEAYNCFGTTGQPPGDFGSKRVAFFNVIKETLSRFLEFTRNEAGSFFIDKNLNDRVNEILERSAKANLANKPREDSSEPIR